MSKKIITVNVNGSRHEIPVAANQTLLEVLREDLRLTGTKFGCELGECGACTVLIDDTPALSCITLAGRCEGSNILTVEGLNGEAFDIIAETFAEAGASQCGYCTPAMAIMFHHALERDEPPEATEALSGNICRCTGYTKIIEAYEKSVKRATERRAQGNRP